MLLGPGEWLPQERLPPPRPPSPQYPLLVFFFVQTTLDLTNPLVVLAVRGLYALLCALQWLAWRAVTADVEARKEAPDMTAPIWVPVKAAPSVLSALIGATEEERAAPAYTQTTMYEHESKLAQEKSTAALMAPGMQLMFSFYMGVHLPLAIQCIMLPLTAAEDALLSKRLLGPLLGWPTPARACGELREDPMLRPAVAAAAAVADGPAQVLAPAATVGDVESEEAVLSAWESCEPLDVGIFEHLRGQGKDVNYRTADGGWSALMVISGSVAHEGRDVSRLLEMGADPALTDAEGWTALHWAAHHGIPAAISAIAAAHGVPASSSPAPGLKRALMRGSVADLLALLNAEDVKGKTPLRVAREASNSKTVDTLEALQSLCRESSLLGRNEELANDAHTPTPVSPEAVRGS